MPRNRNKEINRRRRRRKRILLIKKKLAEATTQAERDYLVERIKRREPFFVPPKK